MISVIIRTKNEEEWLEQCLHAVFAQEFVDFEVIIVDNNSTDSTLDIVKKFDCKLVKISDKEFTYGGSLNKGIKASKGDFIAMISGHCIPKNTNWLLWLQNAFTDDKIVGVYGRQEPIESTNPLDKRDMWNTFGLERKEQTVDPFFHNANSMITRKSWEEISFDETVSGVEDRIWAKAVLAHGYKIVYEPNASVYHPHGLNQAGDEKRAERVVDVIQKYKLH